MIIVDPPKVSKKVFGWSLAHHREAANLPKFLSRQAAPGWYHKFNE
jgi:hypothetical protein